MTPRQARLGVDIFTGLVIASVGLALASLTWRLQGHSGIGPAAAPVASSAGEPADIRPLIALAPFGSALSVAADGSDMAIRLRAVFLASPSEASVALIAGADGKVASYGIGQAVGGGVIEAIMAEQIVLRLPSGLRAIGFDPQAGPSQTGAPDAASAGRFATAAPHLSPPPAGGAAQIASGIRVGAAPPAALIAAGIRPGDVIERVNGTAVNAATSERDLIARTVAAGSARVELLRDGQRVSLTVTAR